MSELNPVRIAVIGAGAMGRNHTSSVKYSIARQRNGNAGHDACRHGNIREAQELAYGDGHRARNRRDNVAARQPLRKEQADKERGADKGCNGGGNIDNGADDGTHRTRNAPCCDEDHVEHEGLARAPILPFNQLGKRDAICLLGKCRGNSQRLTLRGTRQMRRDRCRVKRKTRGDGGNARDNRRCRYARQPKIADHKLAAARHKRAAQGKDHPGLHSRLPHDHSARRAYCNIGKHHRPDGSNDFEHHTLLILTRSPSRM